VVARCHPLLRHHALSTSGSPIVSRVSPCPDRYDLDTPTRLDSKLPWVQPPRKQTRNRIGTSISTLPVGTTTCVSSPSRADTTGNWRTTVLPVLPFLRFRQEISGSVDLRWHQRVCRSRNPRLPPLLIDRFRLVGSQPHHPLDVEALFDEACLPIRVPTQLPPRPPMSSVLRIALNGLPWTVDCVNSSFNLAASLFPFPANSSLLYNFCFFSPYFLMILTPFSWSTRANVVAIRTPNVDHRLHPGSHFHPRHASQITFFSQSPKSCRCRRHIKFTRFRRVPTVQEC
jgi:hypothetical protein